MDGSRCSAGAPAPPSLVLLELADPGLPSLESYSPFCLEVHRALKLAGLSYVRRTAENAVLDQLDARAPAEGFWLGARVSVADVALVAQLHSLCTPLTPWQGVQVQRRARLAAWLARVDTATSGVPLRSVA